MINPKSKRDSDQTRKSEHVAGDHHALLLEMVGRGKRVLEFGCAAGAMSRSLSAAGNRVTGIELDAKAAAQARAACEEVIVADLDTRLLVDLLPATPFDAAVFSGILERLRDPRQVLDEARALLGPHGYAVISVPNVAHGAVRLSLLRGRFDRSATGSAETEQLHYFTLRSVHELCLRAGYRVAEVGRTKVPLFGAATESLPQLNRADFDEAIVAEIEADPDHDTLQFVLRAVPLDDGQRLSDTIDIAVDSEARAHEARAALERMEREMAALRGLDERFQLQRALLDERSAVAERALALEREKASLERELLTYRSRSEALSEHLLAANERVAEAEKRQSDFRAETLATRGALERANEDVAAAREAASNVRNAVDLEVARLREAIADWQSQTEAARSAVDELKRERDLLRLETKEIEAARMHAAALEEAQHEVEETHYTLEETRRGFDEVTAALEDARKEALRLRGVEADRERLVKELRRVEIELEDAVSAFFAHTDAELDKTRREIAHVDLLIRQVQSSRWWRIKTAVGKMRGAVAARVRRRLPLRFRPSA